MSMFLSSKIGKKAQPPPQHSLAQEKAPHAPSHALFLFPLQTCGATLRCPVCVPRQGH